MAAISYLLTLIFISSFATAIVSTQNLKNLAIRVEESSKSPDYLAIRFLNLDPQSEIVAVDVSPAGSYNWNFMNRKEGDGKVPIWETNRVPTGPLQFKVVVTAGLDGKWYIANKVLPQSWRNGEIYDTGIVITDSAIHSIDDDL